MAFHGSGSDGLFERCFEKAANYIGCDWNIEAAKKRRRWAYHFLRSTGYIDVVRMQSKWSMSPPALVQSRETTFILIGGMRQRESLVNTVSKKVLREVPSIYKDNLLPAQMSFFPSLIELSATQSDAVQIGKEIGIDVCLDYQQSLFKYLPALNHVLNSVLTKISAKPIFEPNSAKYFDASRKEWTPYNGMLPDRPGLYRNDPKYSYPSYFCATVNEDGLNAFLVEDREWAIICFCALFDVKLPITYNVNNGNLCINSSGFEELRLPTLLEKCLRSGSLREPEFTHQGMVYENIRYANFWRLVSKFPIFSLEQHK